MGKKDCKLEINTDTKDKKKKGMEGGNHRCPPCNEKSTHQRGPPEGSPRMSRDNQLEQGRGGGKKKLKKSISGKPGKERRGK